jgi:hypothetical protein
MLEKRRKDKKKIFPVFSLKEELKKGTVMGFPRDRPL